MKGTVISWRTARVAILIIAACLLVMFSASITLADPAIVGGQEADPGEWPWQVALVSAGGSPYEGQFCGGSIIARDWVLTAAHCVHQSEANEIDIIAGIHDLKIPGPNIRRVGLAQIYAHPGYNDGTKDNDIALLRLKSPIDPRPAAAGVLPIAFVAMAPPSTGDLTGVLATVTGWGNRSTSGNDYPDRLHEVQVPIISNADCSNSYSNITDNMVCAGYAQGGKDSCQGDSGGPLVRQTGGNWQLVGIVSFGRGCAQPDAPGVYARVSRYGAWMNSIMNPFVATNRFFIPVALDIPPGPPPTPLRNGNFELGGNVGWSESSTNGYDIITNDFLTTGVTAHGGTWAAWLGGANNEISVISQQVTVPQGQSVLVYYHWIASADLCGFDGAAIVINNTNVHQYDLCGNSSTNGWVRKTVNLGAYAGQNVTLKFVVDTDGSVNSNLFVDDVSFTANMAADEPEPARDSVPNAAAAKAD